MIQFIYDVTSCILLSWTPVTAGLTVHDFYTLCTTPMEERESMDILVANKPVTMTLVFFGLILVKSVAYYLLGQ